jgi:hypothetical protein
MTRAFLHSKALPLAVRFSALLVLIKLSKITHIVLRWYS